MSAVRAVLGQALRLGDDDAPVAARSRRDRIVDSVLFLFAAVLAIAAGVNNARHGLNGPLLVIDAIGGALLCLALWWRRRWPLGLGLASLPVACDYGGKTTKDRVYGPMPIRKLRSDPSRHGQWPIRMRRSSSVALSSHTTSASRGSAATNRSRAA